MPAVTEVTDLAKFKEIIASEKPTIVDFWATWCGPCKMIAPVYSKFSDVFTDVTFLKVDTDEAQEIAQEYGVRVMPTFMIFKKGEKVTELKGAMPGPLNQALVDITKPAEDAPSS